MSHHLHKHYFRGQHVVVGGRRVPSPEAIAAFHARAMFHDLVPTAQQGRSWVPPTPPASTSYASRARTALATMLRNNELGCCAEAADLHLDALRCAVAGAPYVPTDAEVSAEYSAAAGYVEGDPSTDQGTDMADLVAWRKGHAYPSGAKLADAVAVDATTKDRVKLALWLSVGLNLGMCLPDAWLSKEAAGDTWDVAGPPNTENGHDVDLVDYDDEKGVLVETWGEQIWMTWEALAKYGAPAAQGVLAAYLADDVVAQMSGMVPAGYSFAALEAFLEHGTPLPAPPSTKPAPPSVPPTPTPPAPPSDPGTLVDPTPPPPMPAEATTSAATPSTKGRRGK